MNNKLAMSRALGAAFLTHQVEQLEKSVSAGPGARNWRERRPAPDSNVPSGRGVINYGGKRSPVPTGAKVARRKPGEGERERMAGEIRIKKREEERREERREPSKDADVVVLDSSVLIHALGQVKKWCRDGREEIIIVPLEALNTLDLLKKGTSHLAQRARAASRILEAQVGTNPRIRVQQDSAFVLWDSITFSEPAADDNSVPHAASSPEWVRRTICCARWEAVNAATELPADRSGTPGGPRIVLAVLSQPPTQPVQQLSPKLANAAASPVPLPVPHANKHEPRTAGALVAHWARRAGIDLMMVRPAPAGESVGARGEDEEERERPKRAPVHRGRKNSSSHSGSERERERGPGGGALVERPPAVKAMMELVAQPSKVVRVLARGEKLDP
ncbi:hypothetical protein HETIRDRAFT_327909 [Heterobasidion irregulare TC 32-1]|uniref:PIN domain-containing protein n=1 Tax=Heterobasidion irregulare (strain TC 32-1) TaxID=747525 RepID=W4JTV5_HETIT|nr:uncharacterized protein HETIRDRAFT_327909 [Heterobasidion irregulare TC 32-1]ETW76535.1 hypothetical protein HETIRDRAFT_327909 [Heterobasidion irregulare TC 32-1]